MSGKGTMKNFRAMLAEAKLPERTVPVCLRADLVADHEAADAELEQAQKRKPGSLAGSGTGALIERLDALEAQMRESTYPFRLRGLSRHAWRDLVNAHPPREVDGELLVEDRLSGVNRETFFEPMLRACIVDPELSDPEFADLAEKLTDRQYEELVNAAWDLNQGRVDIPFSRAASQARRPSSDG